MSSDSLVRVVEVHNVVHRLAGEAEVHHPVHQVEGDEHDGEDDPAVLVNVTGSHSKQPSRRLGRQCRRGQGEQRGTCIVLSAHVSCTCQLSFVTR